MSSWLEIAGAIGLILPPAVGVQDVLSPVVAVGLALIMLAAVVVHARRSENAHLGMPVALAPFAILISVLRFGPYAI